MFKKTYLNLEIKELESNKDNYVFEGYAAVFNNIDYGDDIILPNAFKESLKSKHKVKILWQHRHDCPIGVPIEIKEDDKGLYIKGKLPKDDEFVKTRVMPQMKVGSLEMSIGYYTKDAEYKDKVRYIKEVFLAEVSLVSIGMNNEAQITDFKSLDIETLKETPIRDLEKMFKNGFKASNSVAKILVSSLKTTEQREAELIKQREADEAEALDNKNLKDVEYLKLINEMVTIKNKNNRSK